VNINIPDRRGGGAVQSRAPQRYNPCVSIIRSKKTTTVDVERRDTPRVPLALDAMVKISDRPFQMHRTRDVSLDGVFVEIGPHRLAPQDLLEVALKIPSSGGPQIYRFSARIARVAPLGVGMVFDHVNTESYAALLDVVFATQPKGSY